MAVATITLARGQANVPVEMQQDGFAAQVPLRFIGSRQGRPTDPFSLAFEIILKSDSSVLVAREDVNIAQFFPNGDKLSMGRYVARFVVGDTWTAATHIINWFVKFTATDNERTVPIEFDVVDEFAGGTEGAAHPLSLGLYATEDEIRAEGFLAEQAEPDRIARLIKLASRKIERVTRRWFEPRFVSFFVDGSGHRRLGLPAPLIEIYELRVISRDNVVIATGSDIIDLDALAIFNRHISQGMMDPDDREDPRLEFATISGSLITGYSRFPRGRQNLQVTGVFGYTDPDPTCRHGVTPPEIKDVCMKMVVRNLPQYEEFEDREDRQQRARLTGEKQGKHGYTLSKNPNLDIAGVTGDPEIDDVLMQFRSPMHVGSAGGVTWESLSLRRPVGLI